MQKSSEKFAEKIYDFSLKHPSIVLALICMFCGAAGFSSTYYISIPLVLFGFALIFVIASICIIKTKNDYPSFYNFLKCLFLGFFVASYFIFFVKTDSRAFFLGAFGIIVLALVSVYLYKIGRLNAKNIIILLFFAGLILRITYVMYTGCMERQHDVHSFGGGNGHAGYIEYILNNEMLPDFDVRNVWQFYHPPLHHIICAIFLKTLIYCEVDYNVATESIQILTLFYSSICMIISYRIMREFNLKGTPLIAAFAIIAFHPTFIIFAGSINNDILSITLEIGAILYAIRWYKSQKLSDIIKIALCVGLGMMTKLSVWMVAPAIAFLFLAAAFNTERKRKFRVYIGQYSLFGTICIPLGLWWGLRNLKLFSVPLTYIPKLDETNAQFVGYHSVFKRLFDFNFSQVENVFDKWGDPYFEYNPTIGLFKTAMFGERLNNTDYPQIGISGTILFWLGTALALLALAAIIMSFKRRYKIDTILKLFLIAVAIVTTIMYYYFCIDFDSTCTQNIRYATPLIVIGALFIGFMLRHHAENEFKFSKILTRASYIGIGAFCFFSMLTYILIGWVFQA